MTDFKKTFVGRNLVSLGVLLGHAWAAISPTLQSAAAAAGKDAIEIAVGAGTAAIQAAAESHASGGGKDDVIKAAEDAAQTHVKTIGVAVALDDLAKMAHAKVTAPLPPDADLAPAT